MRSLLRSLRPAKYQSVVGCTSKTVPGVSFTVRRMSLGRRIRLAAAIRDLASEFEFHQAGGSPKDQVEAAVLSARIDRIYLLWGVKEIRGLLIDGENPSADTLFSRGPEALLREIVDRIKKECGLTEDERKN